MFKRILIANRGEIACRIIKTAKTMGITTIAVFSDADADACHTMLADEAYRIGPSPAIESYLAINKIIQCARDHNAEAIHPGYGFLSENAEFARACRENNIVFIGPSPEVLEAMGSKAQAKAMLEPANVPMVPGYHGQDQSTETLLAEAKKIGFPVLLKAALGGGGKGMRIVDNENNFHDALAGAKREAQKSFADDRMIIEKYLVSPRHIECQVFADQHGSVVHLFERDCSLQRRHQKIIEEAPADHFSESCRQRLTEAAITVAKTIDYQNAGTIEFLVSGEDFYFMEMNTRLQVEHPVTEMITGLDLVAWQLKVAAGEPLPLTQDQIKRTGHAIEVRLYAEDPENGFLPSTGRIDYLNIPAQSRQVRFDSGFQQGDEISPHYDPMIAKLIVYDQSRTACIEHLSHALKQCQISGVKTNIDFARRLINHDAFLSGEFSTQFLGEHESTFLAKHQQQTIAALLLSYYQYRLLPQQTKNPKTDPNSPWGDGSAWQANLAKQIPFSYIANEQAISVTVNIDSTVQFMLDGQQYRVSGEINANNLSATINNEHYQVSIFATESALTLFGLDETYRFAKDNLAAHYSNESEQGQLTSPMPAAIVALHVKAGDMVNEGDKLMVLEAMKMEHTITAPHAGIVDAVYFQVGDQVEEGLELIALRET